MTESIPQNYDEKVKTTWNKCLKKISSLKCEEDEINNAQSFKLCSNDPY